MEGFRFLLDIFVFMIEIGLLLKGFGKVCCEMGRSLLIGLAIICSSFPARLILCCQIIEGRCCSHSRSHQNRATTPTLSPSLLMLRNTELNLFGGASIGEGILFLMFAIWWYKRDGFGIGARSVSVSLLRNIICTVFGIPFGRPAKFAEIHFFHSNSLS